MDRKDHSSHQTRQHTGPCSDLSYLPDGWKFAIVTVKPPKGYKDRRQTVRRSIHRQAWGVGLPGKPSFVKPSSKILLFGPLSPPDEGSGAKWARDHLCPTLTPKVKVTIDVSSQNTGF